MSNITLEEIRTELAGFVQDTVDALGYANYGSDYKGKWAAGDYDVETVVSHNLRFYSSLVARTATDTADPSLDTAAWKLLGSAATIRGISQDNVDALGHSTYGSLYKGLWAAGVHAVGEYRSYGGRYYRCKTDRTASDTDSPPMDEAGWEVVGSSFVVQGDIETAKQENIDTAADLVFGSSYRGKWRRASYDPGDVVYDEEGKGFYECDIARTQRNRNPPSVNTSHWSRVDPLNKVVKDSTGLARVKSQAFTSNGAWTKPENVENVRVFLIGAGGGGAGGKRGGTGQATSGYNPNKPFDNAGYGGGPGRSTGGGAAGQFVDAVVPVTGDVAVTIGAGGEGGEANSNGSDGGDTTFGSIIRAHGGGGGKTTGGEAGRGLGGADVTGAGDGVGFPYGISSRNGGVYDQVNSNFCYGDGGVLESDGAGTNNEPDDGWTTRGGRGLGGQRGGSGAGGYGDGGAGGNGGDGGSGGRSGSGVGQPGTDGTDGGDAAGNTGAGGGAGGGGGGGVSGNYGERKNGGAGGMGGAGGRGGSGYAVVFWTE